MWDQVKIRWVVSVKQLGGKFRIRNGFEDFNKKKNMGKAESGEKMSWEKKVKMRKEERIEN